MTPDSPASEPRGRRWGELEPGSDLTRPPRAPEDVQSPLLSSTGPLLSHKFRRRARVPPVAVRWEEAPRTASGGLEVSAVMWTVDHTIKYGCPSDVPLEILRQEAREGCGVALSLGRLGGHGFPGQRSPSDLLRAGRRYETPWQAESSSLCWGSRAHTQAGDLPLPEVRARLH